MLPPVYRFHRRPPKLVPLAGDEGQVEGEAVYETFVALHEGGTDIIGVGLYGEGVEHLVGY